MKYLTTPTSDWGPANEKHKQAVEVISTRLDARIPLTEPEIVIVSHQHEADAAEKTPLNCERSEDQQESQNQSPSSDQSVC